ncbi:hypothetical protein OS493_004446 [Desmophyllum pertusum]|uniref:Uncharacterized protein n=1 Tax=Desmophyllum pertusum TaxID=174260 RepID=A0A9X0D6H5_9CNID|nr:hypothetical protein OS493_004446 [Desmophyllum pertusum]
MARNKGNRGGGGGGGGGGSFRRSDHRDDRYGGGGGGGRRFEEREALTMMTDQATGRHHGAEEGGPLNQTGGQEGKGAGLVAQDDSNYLERWLHTLRSRPTYGKMNYLHVDSLTEIVFFV